MLKLKEIKLDDKELFLKHIGESENSTLSFTTLYIWSFDGRIKYDVVDECLVLVFCGKKGCMCTYPYGNGDRISAAKKAYEFMENPCFVLMDEEQANELNTIFPDEFDIISDENNADYVYLTEDLINLKGNKYQQKRNHLNAFLKNYEYTYERLTIDDVDEIKELFFKWEKSQTNHDTGDSKRATLMFLENIDKLGVTCAGIRVGGKLVAFTGGEAITDHMAHVPMEFADTDYRGAFNVINRDFCKNEWSDYKYINREEDMGVEGMRYAKRAYNPVRMIEKYRAIRKKK